MNKNSIILILLLSGILGFATSYYFHRNADTKPRYYRETFHYPATFVKQLIGDPQAGKKIFTEFCAVCHAATPSITVNAPLVSDHNAWEMRKKMGMPVLLQVTVHGVGAMPARGGCFECSDQQLQEAIKYMLEQSHSRK